MNWSVTFAAFCAVIAALWSMEQTRGYALDWLPSPLDDVVERWLGVVLPPLVFALLVFSVKPPPIPPKPISCVGSGGSDSEPSVNPRSVADSGAYLNARVVARDVSGKTVPVPIGTARIGQIQTQFTSEGTFQLRVPSAVQSDSLVEIASEGYLRSFLRVDDPVFAERRPIELRPKMKIIVVPSTETTRKESAASLDAIRRAFESELSGEQIQLLSDNKLRDDIVRQLYNYQENGALYDPRTLARVGNFYGATDGVFWTIDRDDKQFTLECKLVDLVTAKVRSTATETFQQLVALPTAVAYVGDVLLSQMSEAKILTPKDATNVHRNVSLHGYSMYIPKTWTLWISMLPEGNDVHFPQRRISTHGDESWFAPDVYAGEFTITQPIRFEVYMVLADAEYSTAIQKYLDDNSKGGLNMNAWSKERFRVLDHISVVRPQ